MSISENSPNQNDTQSQYITNSKYKSYEEIDSEISEKERIQIVKAERRGYKIDIKLVVLAFAIEAVLISCGLVVAWIQAKNNINDEIRSMLAIGYDQITSENYANGRFILAFIGAVGFAMVELTRVPLALVIRTHKSKVIQIISIVGVLAAAGLTFKTMSQAADAMYAYRNLDVSKATNELENAKGRLQSDTARLKDIENKLKIANGNVNEIVKQIDGARDVARQAAGKTNCKTQFITADDGTQIAAPNCTEVSSVNQANQQIKEYNKKLDESKIKVQEISIERSNFINSILAKDNDEINEKDHSLKAKKIESQIYSLAASLLRKDKMTLTEEDISITLQYLTYIPALLVAFDSTLIAIAAVTRVSPRPMSTIILPDGAGEYLLAPLTQAILEELQHSISEAITKNGVNSASENAESSKL